jgi:zinc transport system substrate-binding protein
MTMTRSRALLACLPLTLALSLSACVTTADEGDEGQGSAAEGSVDATDPDATTAPAAGQDDVEEAEPLVLVASFYPLEWLSVQVAGDRAEVTTLTAAGVDPHDVELTPRTVGTLGSADLVLYAAGMQPAVDDAVAQQAQGHSLDVTTTIEMLENAGEDSHDDHGHEDHADDGHDGHGHGHGHDEDHTDEGHDDHDHGPEDPHFWLDPERYGQVAQEIAAELGQLDPDHAELYETNAAELVAELDRLDQEFDDGLADCASRELVTTHEAFGYLADRYDLTQTGVTGIAPESEPSPARLAEVAAMVQERGISTIYAEPILTADIAQTVARETGAQVLVLDPVEGVTDASAGTDYLEIMRANLQSLREGQSCP